MKLMLTLDENEVITDAKFQTFGCGSAIASASALTEMIIGKKLDEAARITNRDIVDYLGGLPAEKMHCSVMGHEALESAINSYRGTAPEAHEDKHKNIVCECFGVTDAEIMRVVKENGLTTVEEVTNYTKAGGGCRSCHQKIIELIESAQHTAPAPPEKKGGKALTNIQKMKMVEETIEKEIRPMLKADGGDIELVDIEGNKVIVALRGMCASCKSARFTLKEYIEPKLKEFVSADLYIEEVNS
jgi:NifU-like protein